MEVPNIIFNCFQNSDLDNNEINIKSKWMQSKAVPKIRKLTLYVASKVSYTQKSKKGLKKDIIDVPYYLPKKYVNPDYYTIRFYGKNSIINSLMTLHDPSWVFYSETYQKEIIDNFSLELRKEFPKLYISRIFRNYNVKKDILYELLSNDLSHPAALHYISEYLNSNIIVFNNLGYNVYCSFKKRATLLLWEDVYCAGGIIHTNGVDHLKYSDRESWSNLDINEERTINNIVASSDELYDKKKLLEKMTKVELIDYAINLSFSNNELENLKKTDILNLIYEKIFNYCIV